MTHIPSFHNVSGNSCSSFNILLLTNKLTKCLVYFEVQIHLKQILFHALF